MAETFQQLKAIPWAAFWSLALATGGLFLISYFASIEYLPDLKIEDLTGTIAAVAVVGMFVIVIVGFGLTLPVLFLKPDRALNKFYVPSQAALGVVTAFAFFVNSAFDYGYRDCGWVAILIGSITACILLTYCCFLKQQWRYEIARTILSVVSWAAWAAVMPMFFYAATAHQNGDGEWAAWVKLFLFPALFACVSIMLASLPDSQKGGFRLATALAAMVLLSLFANRPALVPQMVVAALGLSADRKPVTLVLTESGCNATNLLLEGKPCTFDAATKLGSLLNARVVSRIGTQFVIHWQPLALSGTKPIATAGAVVDERWRRAILKKDDVVSWAYDYSKHVKDVQSQGR